MPRALRRLLATGRRNPKLCIVATSRHMRANVYSAAIPSRTVRMRLRDSPLPAMWPTSAWTSLRRTAVTAFNDHGLGDAQRLSPCRG